MKKLINVYFVNADLHLRFFMLNFLCVGNKAKINFELVTFGEFLFKLVSLCSYSI